MAFYLSPRSPLGGSHVDELPSHIPQSVITRLKSIMGLDNQDDINEWHDFCRGQLDPAVKSEWCGLCQLNSTVFIDRLKTGTLISWQARGFFRLSTNSCPKSPMTIGTLHRITPTTLKLPMLAEMQKLQLESKFLQQSFSALYYTPLVAFFTVRKVQSP